MQMTLQMLAYFVILITMFNFQYYALLHLQKMSQDKMTLIVLLCTNTWFIIYLIKFVSLNHTCESVSAKVSTFDSLEKIVSKLHHIIFVLFKKLKILNNNSN